MSGSSVFVVDDSPTLCSLVSFMVQSLGGTPHVFPSASRCLEGLQHQQPSMILMDLQMAGMSGDECCRHIKADGALRNIPVVMMTVADQPEQVRRCLEAGADDFLPKPILMHQLADKVAAVRRTPATANRAVLRDARQLLVVGRGAAAARRPHVQALEQAGFRLQFCESTTDAVALLAKREERMDAILLDLSGAPWEDSLSFLRTLQLLGLSGAQCPVLATSDVEVPPRYASELEAFVSGAVFRPTAGLDGWLAWVDASFRRAALEHRGARRVPYFTIVEFRRAGEGEWSSGFTSNLGASGVYVRGLNPLTAGTAIELRGVYGIRHPDVVEGVVAWSNRASSGSGEAFPRGMGIRFTRVDAARLKRLLAV